MPARVDVPDGKSTVTYMPGVPIACDPPTGWTACSRLSDGSPRCCGKCNGPRIVFRTHESSCGGYNDDELKCLDCGYLWWIDGVDA